MLLVVSPRAAAFDYPTQLSNSKNIYGCYFFPMGITTLHVSYPKNVFSFDDDIQVITHLDNMDCSVKMKSIKLQLFQRIILRDKLANTKFKLRKIFEESYKGVYVIINLHQHANEEMIRTLSVVVQDRDNPTSQYLDKSHAFLFDQVGQIPKLQTSVCSEFIECGYFLKVSVEVGGFVSCSIGPSIDIPLILSAPDIVKRDLTQYKPINWQPSVMNDSEFPSKNGFSELVLVEQLQIAQQQEKSSIDIKTKGS